MFEFLGDNLFSDDIDVSISFHQDVRDCREFNCVPYDVLVIYLHEFPEFYHIILTQFLEDEAAGFPSDEDLLSSFLPVQTFFIISQENFIKALNYFQQCLYELYLSNNPQGKMLLEIEDRIEYLDKYYANKQIGFKPPLKDW